jgi:biotin transport system substrate-specific component
MPYQLLWATIGLILTIGGTFVEAFVTNSPWHWSGQGIQAQSLGVTCQIGAVLLVGCLGGKNAGAIAQITYVILGLTGIYPVFTQGGGFSYLLEPTFGYLLGFIPGTWLCGLLAFRHKVTLESLAFSCIIGLLAIHLVGIIYLTGLQLLSPLGNEPTFLVQAIEKYSVDPLASQVAIVCAVSVLGYILRQILFY